MLGLVYLIHLLQFVSGECKWGFYPDPNNPSGQTCIKCDEACGDCTAAGAYSCGQCSSSYSKIQGICMQKCPLGFNTLENICKDKTTDGICFNLNFQNLKNAVEETVKVEDTIVSLSAGSSSDFYPNYDSSDPKAIKERGFYFDGSSYFIGNDNRLTFGPVFTLALWIKPLAQAGYLFAKQSDSSISIALKLANYFPTLDFNLNPLSTYQSASGMTLNTWGFLMVKMTLENFKAKVSITVNSNVGTSVFSTYFTDLFSNFHLTFAAQYSSSQFIDYYKGFIWMFRLANQDLPGSTFVTSSGCTGCSICPVGNSNACLSNCDFNQYIQESACISCTDDCKTVGCVRGDHKCNLCQDQKCYVCESFGNGCKYCIPHAYLNTTDGLCVCDYNYIWDDVVEICRPCGLNCQTCDGKGYLGCSQCKSGFYMHWGLCLAKCPTGYTGSGGDCVLSGSTRVLHTRFNKIEGVVLDIINKVASVTGTSEIFYPDYESDDPIAAYRRGYYFTGSSLMHFAPYLTYSSPYLMFSPACFIGIWVNPETNNGILLSSVNSTYSPIAALSLENGFPVISLSLADSSLDYGNAISYKCTKAVDMNKWSYLVVKIELDNHERTFITCYINQVATDTGKIGQGHLSDTKLDNKMIAGTQQTGSSTYKSNYFKGFIYEIIIDVDLNNPNSGYSTTCEQGCSACPVDKTCLSLCKINEFPSGTNMMSCTECNSGCKTKGCINSEDSCNLCGDSTCKVCFSYDSNDCSSYFCSSSQYRKKGMTQCKDCDPSCATCDGDGPMNCTSCTGTYLLNGGCHSFCPTGYTLSDKRCIMNQDNIFKLNLEEIRGLVPEGVNNFKVIAGNNKKFYPDFDKNDPIPVINRGHYFNGSSYLDLPPNTESQVFPTLGNQFTFSFWFRSETPGVLFSKQDSTFASLIKVQVVSNKLQLDLKLNALSTMTSSSSFSSNWTYITISISYTLDSTTRYTLRINLNQESLSLGAGKFTDILSACYLTIGAERSAQSIVSFWKGFLYSFNIFSSSKDPKEFSSSCISDQFSCSICPNDQMKCLDTCPSTSWWNSFECQDCQKCSYESCRRNDLSCNLCIDVQCKVCHTFWSGSCDECKENADLKNGECSCKDGFFWDNFQEKCVTCSGNKVVAQGNCVQTCPTGFQVNSKNCVGVPALVFEAQLDKKIRGRIIDSVAGKIELVTGLTTEFYPYYDLNDPYAGKDRGYYFDGLSSYMAFIDKSDSTTELIFSPSFAVAFWVNPSTPGVIFSKRSSGTIWIQLNLTSDLKLTLSIMLDQYNSLKTSTSSKLLLRSSWNHIGFSIKSEDDTSSTLKFFINKESELKRSLGLTGFVDIFTSYTFTLGAAFNSSYRLTEFFTGYIQSFKVWNYDFNLDQEVKTSCSECSLCPSNGVCLPTCSLNKFYSSTCKDCKGLCSKGCVRAEDCNLCYDRLCEFCDDYTSTGCSKCVDGADFNSGFCKCLNGTEKTRNNGNLYCQTPCSTNCLECFSLQNGDCSLCKDGFWLDDGLCVLNCPSGKKSDNKKCVETSKTRVIHFVFNKTINNPPDLVKGLKAFMGSSEKYLKEYDQNDPIPVYKRGVFFDGNSKYIQLPKNPAETTEVFLGNLHSIKTWIRAQTQSSTGCIMTKESDVQYLSLMLDSSLTPSVVYKVKDIYDQSKTSTVSSTGKILTNDKWHELVIHFVRSGRSSTSTVFVNGQGSSTSYSLQSFFDEPSGLSFKLGYSNLTGLSFKGFIYEFIIFNYLITPNDPSTYPCYCDICTETGDCLNSCQSRELITGKTCASCLDQCQFSCLDNEDCSLNPDPLCEIYSGFEGKDCTKCVKLAEMTQNGCKCGLFTVAFKYSCECISQYEELQNKCVPCFYHLQTTDINSYFSEDYLSLEFDMKIPVQTSTSSQCSELFTEESLKKIGKGASCQWIDQMNKLKVKLGDQATVLNGTLISFKINTLLTNIQQCGSNRGPISSSLYFKFAPPMIIPESIIDAPFEYYIFCGNLSISGARSTGGYGRILSFVWTFDSNPYLEVLTNRSDLTSPDLEYSNETLSPSTVTVFLKVTNWLGFNNTANQTIEINEGVGIQLSMDKNIKWKLTTQYSKSIYVSPNSLCKISNDLTYTWSLFSMTGSDSYFKEDLFWSSQITPSKLYIPKGSLGPGSYSFKLSVHDNELNINGKTFLNFIVLYSDLEVNFNPSYTTFNKQIDLVLNGDAAQDPDDISGNFEYYWTCFNGSDCNFLFSAQKVKNPIILKESLDDFKEYVFNLSVTKGNRKGFGILTVLVNSTSRVSAFFQKLPDFINNQENLVIKPELDLECNCTYQWEVIEGKGFLMKDSSSLHLGIQPYTLNEGEVYKAQLSVFDDFKGKSVFRQTFQVDLLPKGGTLELVEFSQSELEVIYKLKAYGWADPKDSNLPLVYQFGFYYKEKERFLNVKNESSVYFTALPHLDPLILFVRVYDIYGCYSEKTLNATVSNSIVSLEKMIDSFKFYVNLEWSDPDILPGLLTQLIVVLLDQFDNTTELQKTFNISMQAIEKMMKSFQDIDFAKLDILLNQAYLLGSLPLDSENKTSIYSLLISLAELVSDHSILMSSKRGESYVEIIQVSSDIQESLVGKNPSTLLQINEILKSLSLASSITMGQSQSLSFGQDSIQVSLTLMRGDTLRNAFQSINSSSVSIPSALDLSFNSSETILTIFVVYNSEPGLYNTSKEYSSAVELTLLKVKGEFTEYIEVNLKPEVLLLTIPVWNLDDDPKCVFWNLDSWSDEGCRLVELDGNKSLCGCSHTSLYSAGSHFISDETDEDKEPIVIYISCIVAFLWLVLIAFLLVKDKRESESKIFVEKILAGLPLAGFKKSPRVRPNDIADQLGRVEKIDEKRDSNYVPAARIGIVGSYFDDKSKVDENELEKLKNSELYSQVKSGVYEKAEILPFAKINSEEALKEQKDSEKTGKPVVQSESVSILPSQNFEEMRKKSSKRMTALQKFEEYEKDSAMKPDTIEEIDISKKPKIIQINEYKGGIPRPLTLPPSNLNLKQAPKLPGLVPIEINPEEEVKDSKMNPKPSQSEQKPYLPEFERKNYNYEAAPTRTSSKNSSFKKPQLSPIEINPNEEEGIDLEADQVPKIKIEQEHKPKKFDYVVAENIENKQDSGEKAAGEPKNYLAVDNKGREEEKFENTELFTQPSSPRSTHQFRRKKHEDQEIPQMLQQEERIYSSWVADYFFSAILYYHEIFSRVARCTQGVSSFLLQVLLVGLILSGMGEKYAKDKGKKFDVKVANLEFQDVAIAFSMAILCNLFTSLFMIFFFRKSLISPYAFDSERNELIKKNKKTEIIGLILFSLVILGSVIGTGILEMTVIRDESILWSIILFIAFIFDFFLIQIVKIVVYHYLNPGLILPSK